VAVDQATGRVFIAGRDGNQLEMIDTATHGNPAPRQS
jgi:DNA-binding beta-propeller fold protein YncE